MLKLVFWCELVYLIALGLDALYKKRLLTRLDIYGEHLYRRPILLYADEPFIVYPAFLPLPVALLLLSERKSFGLTPCILVILGQLAIALLVSYILARNIHACHSANGQCPTFRQNFTMVAKGKMYGCVFFFCLGMAALLLYCIDTGIPWFVKFIQSL